APAARASRFTASSGSSRPRMADTLRLAIARSAITMLVPVWRAMVTATSAARPAGASMRTLSACAGTLATIAASPIDDAARILPRSDLPSGSIMAHTHAEERAERARIAAYGLDHQA